MKVIASTGEYTIFQRRNGRYAVKGADKRPINADEKVIILLKHELIVAGEPKAPQSGQASAEQGTDESETEETGETTAEDADQSEQGDAEEAAGD